jgi:hypothetical protein
LEQHLAQDMHPEPYLLLELHFRQLEGRFPHLVAMGMSLLPLQASYLLNLPVSFVCLFPEKVL